MTGTAQDILDKYTPSSQKVYENKENSLLIFKKITKLSLPQEKEEEFEAPTPAWCKEEIKPTTPEWCPEKLKAPAILIEEPWTVVTRKKYKNPYRYNAFYYAVSKQ